MKKNRTKRGLFMQRLLAFAIDIFLVSFLASLLCMPFLDYDSIDTLRENASQIMVDYEEGNIDIETYISSASSILYRLAQKQGPLTLATIFLNILYFVVYQFYYKGQTLGKKLLRVKVVSADSKELTMNNYIYRSFAINSVLTDIIIFTFVVFASQRVWFGGTLIFATINYIVLFVCAVMVIFSKDGRGLHDLIGNTKVIECSK